MDKRIAKIVSLNGKEEVLTQVKSNVEEFHPKGGSGSSMKGGPQDVVQDSKYLEREKHQLKSYFLEIRSKISQVDSMVIFGPAETGQKFAHELSKTQIELFKKIQKVEKADSMTDNQIRAWVKSYFGRAEG